MAKPNYQFEKRQRELAKKKKKEEKSLRKSSPTSSDGPAEDAPEGQSDEQPGDGDASPPSQPAATE